MIRSPTALRLLALGAAVALAACDRDVRQLPMRCEVVSYARDAAHDPAQLPRHAVSPLVATALTPRDATATWAADVGWTVTPTGPAPAVRVPAPVPFGDGEDTQLVLDVTTTHALPLDVAWADDACPEPGPPCMVRRLLHGEGRQLVPIDLAAHQGAPRTLEIRLPADAGPVTLHALRAGVLDVAPGGADAADEVVLAPDRAPALVATDDAPSRFEPGVGVRLPAGATTVAFQLARPATRARFLVVDVDAPAGSQVRAHFTAGACPHFMEACALPLAEIEPGTFAVDAMSSPWWRNDVAALRLDVRTPSPADVVVRRIDFVSQRAWHERLAAQTMPITVIGDERPARILASQGLTVRPAEDGGIAIALDRAPDPASFAPWLLVAVDAAADLASLLVVEDEGIPAETLRLYFTGSACRHLGESCRTVATRAWGGRFSADLSRVPRWSGTIAAMRIDFPAEPGATFVLRRLAFEPPLATSSFADEETGSLRRGPQGLSRLEGGPLGWDVPAGHALECRFGGGLPPRDALPSSLAVRVPVVPDVIDFTAVRAEWLHESGRPEEAASFTDAYATPRAAEWTAIPLAAPASPPSGLRVSVTCRAHCKSMAQPDRVVQVARPGELVEAPHPTRPRHLLVLSLDTLRADHVPGYGAPRDVAPFLADFAASATLYEHVYGVDTYTFPTHVAMLTGRYPTAFSPRGFAPVPDGVPTLASELAADGWSTIASADGIIMNAVHGLDRGFDRFDSRYEPFDRKRETFVATVAAATATGQPVFAFLHTYAVHGPYSTPPGPALRWLQQAGTGTAAVPFTDLEGLLDAPAFRAHEPEAVRHLVARYDGSLRALDAQLAELFADPRLRDFLADAVVVVTSDHGEEFFEHGGLGHGRHLPYPELTRVPLLIRVPGVAAARDAQLRSQTEVPGLILRALGRADTLPVTGPCTEHGLPMAVVSNTAPEDYPIRSFDSVAVFDEGWQALRVTERATRRIVVDETLPLAGWSDPPPAPRRERLLPALECLAATLATPKARAAARGVPDAQRERLRALGYAE